VEATGRRAEVADAVAAEPAGKGRLVWIGVAGVVVAIVAILGMWSLFDQRDAVPARSDSPPPVEPVAASPAGTTADAAPAPDRVRASVDGADLAVPVAVPAPAAREPILDEPPAAERAGDTESSGAGVARAPAVVAASPDRASDAAPAARARRIVAIEPAANDDGELLLLRADAPFRRQDIFAALIGPDPPRYLLRLSGIERPWRPPALDVGSPLIQRVRTGLHSTPRGLELHVVLDLSTRQVEHSFEVEGEALRVRLRPRTP
jgi:hypothetical protein